MVEKQVIEYRAQLSEKTERLVPPELRKIVDDIERELSRIHSVFSETPVPINDQNIKQASVRQQNSDIDARVKGKMKNGMGIGFTESGDLYSGTWKNGLRDGSGSCKFFNGGYYRGEWSADEMSGQGVLVLKNGLTISGKF